MINSPSLEEKIDEAVKSEVRDTIMRLDQPVEDYFLLSLETLQQKYSMKNSFFYKYVRNQPEMKAIERHPRDPETGLLSKKPFYLPSEAKEAIRRIALKWDTEI